VALDAASLRRVTALAEGAEVRLPLLDGDVVTGVVRRRQEEPSGLVILGGDLVGQSGGTFTLSEGRSGLRATILLPARKKAYTVGPGADAGGQTLVLTEKEISDVVCTPYPTIDRSLPVQSDATGGDAAAAAGAVPVLSSRPGATAVMYIDMDGESVTDPSWNGGKTIDAAPPVLTTAQMVEIWQRVAEDYAPFAVDITTDVRRYNAAAVGHRMRCIVTPNDTAARGAGGVAYINSFSEAGQSFSDTIPCWVFNPGVIGIAEAVSHELGHTVGLRHDGRRSPSEEYYLGQGSGPLSWAPIMGAGYYCNVVQWSKGEYASANNQEDDVAVIASSVNGFGFSTDEAGDTADTAAPLVAGALGDVSLDAVIQSASDADLYRFTAPAGRVRFDVNPAQCSPNLDVLLELKDANGSTLSTANPDLALAASLTFDLPATGTYYLRVSGTGHGDPLVDGYTRYGSIGAYSISGAIPVGDGAPILPDGEQVTATRSMPFRHQIRVANSPTSYGATGLPAGLSLDTQTGVISGTPTAPIATYTVALSVANAAGTRSGSLTIVLTAEPVPTITVAPLRLLRLGQPSTLPITASALPQSYAVSGLPPGLALDPVTGVISGTPRSAGSYQLNVSATNASGTGTGSFVLAVVQPTQPIALGTSHGLVLAADGTLWGVGDNSSGQLGDGGTVLRSVPVVVDTGVTAVAVGGTHSVYLKADGSLWGMGNNYQHQLGSAPVGYIYRPVQIATGVVMVAAGSNHTVWVNTAGAAWTTGYNTYGQLADGTTTPRAAPAQVADGIVAIAAGGDRTFLIKSDASLWGAGSNDWGQLGVGTTIAQAAPVRVAEDVFSAAASDTHTLLVKGDGSLWGMGYNGLGQLGGPNLNNKLSPVRIAAGVTCAAAGSNTTAYTTTDTTLWRLGRFGAATYKSADRVASNVAGAAAGSESVLYVTWAGRFFGLGSNRHRILGDGSPYKQGNPVRIAMGVSSAAVGLYHSLIVKDDGALWSCGENTAGQLGDGTSNSRGVPTKVASGVLSASAGAVHSVFVGTNQQAWAMGQLADRRQYFVPTKQSPGALAVVAGRALNGSTTYTLGVDGRLWAEGDNDVGQLGDGTTTLRLTPVFVANDVVGVGAGSRHALYWTSDGSLYGMGANDQGQLGDGTTVERHSPVRIAGGVRKAAGGSSHSLYLTGTGELYAMGYNNGGQLADGTRTSRLVPVRVATNVIDIAASSYGTYYITSDHSLWAASGDFDGVQRIARGATRVFAAGGHVLYTRLDRTLWGFGDDFAGQLGDVPCVFADTPVEIVLGRPGNLTTILPIDVALGGTTTLRVSGTGAGPLTYQWRKDGVAITGATASSYTITGARSVDGGVYDVVVSNAQGSAISAAGPLTILNAPPRITSPDSAALQRLVPASLAVTAENMPEAFAASGLPTGLTIDAASGLITGTPTAAAGVYPVTVTVTNANGSTTATLTITVAGVPAPQITSGGTLVARRGSACAYQVAGAPAISSYGSADLPAGLSIAATTGLISGTPTGAPGLYSATVSVTNDGGTATNTLRIVILSEVQDRVAGEDTTFYVDAAGVLWAAGRNEFGQLGEGTTVNRGTALHVADGVAAVMASVDHTLFLKMDGTLWAMGWNIQGSFGLGDRAQRNVPVQIATDVIAASPGYNHNLFIKSDDTAWAVGYNYAGHFGNGTTVDSLVPVQVATDVVAVGAGATHSMYLKRDGSLWTSGGNGSGELGDGTYEMRTTMIQVATGVVSIAASGDASLFIKADGTLWGMGFNGCEQLRTRGPNDDLAEPSPIRIADNVVAVAPQLNQLVYLTRDGTLWGRGYNAYGQLGRAASIVVDTRILATNVESCAAGATHTVFRRTDGSLCTLGSSTTGQIADGTDAQLFVPTRLTGGVKAVAAGDSFTLFLTSRGDLLATGYNGLGSLGDGSNEDRATPVHIAADVSQMATGFWHCGYVTSGGALWMMGNNGDGELGRGTVEVGGLNTPVHVMDGVATVSTGVWHTAVLRRDGTVWTMGANSSGQLGDGTTNAARVPTQVLAGVAEIATGAKHTLFLKTDGTLWAAGNNEAGQLGDGTTTNRPTPFQVATGVAHVAAGGWHTLFIKTDGTLWGIGYNGFGQLGDQTTTNRSTPVLVDRNVRSVTAGVYHSAYIKSDGSLWTMGRDVEGQLGDGAAEGTAAMPPAAAPEGKQGWSLTAAPALSSRWRERGVASGFATAKSPFVLTPSAEPSAELGRNRAVVPSVVEFLLGRPASQRSVPVKVATGVKAAAAGTVHSVYVRANGSAWGMGQTLFGALGNGGGLIRWEPYTVPIGLPAIRDLSVPYSTRLGQTVNLAASAVGSGSLAYQWRKDGIAIPGATSAAWLLSGVTAADGGVYDVVVTNAVGSVASTAVNLAVTDAVPVFAGNLTLTAARLADGFAWQPDVGNDPTTFTADNLPAGLTLDAATGAISGRVEAPVGVVVFTLHATNVNGTTAATVTLDVTGQLAPVLSGTPVAIGRRTQAFRYAISATNMPDSYEATGLPAGLSIDGSTGVVAGTITAAAGDYDVLLSAQNATGSGSLRLKLVVLPESAGIAAGGSHSLVIASDGSLWAAGANASGQLGDGTKTRRDRAKKVAENVVAVGASSFRSAFLTSTGELWEMGSTSTRLASRVRSFSIGGQFTHFIDWDDTLWGLGNNSWGQLGDGTTTSRDTPVRTLSDVRSVEAGWAHALVLKRDGTLWAMGYNAYGQLGDGTHTDRATPVQIATDVAAMAAGDYHSAFVRSNGEAWTVGYNGYGQLGDGTYGERAVPAVACSGVARVWARSGTLFLMADGTLWGTGWTGLLYTTRPVQILQGAAGASLGGSHLLALDTLGRTLVRGDNGDGQLGEPIGDLTRPCRTAYDVAAVSGGDGHTLLIRGDGTLWSMGQTGSGARGPNVTDKRMLPVEGAGHVTAIGAGQSFTLYVRADGTEWGMGSNWYGQIPRNGPYPNSPVLAASDVTAVAAGRDYSIYLASDGTAWSSGYRVTPTTDARAVPVKVGEGIAQIAAAGADILLVKSDGTLWATELLPVTDSTATPVLRPRQLAVNVTATAGGAQNQMYVTADGTLWGQGANNGALGDGTTLFRGSAVQIATGVTGVSANYSSTYFVKTDGSLWATGENGFGELGDGTHMTKLRPVLIATGVRTVRAAPYAAFMVKRDGSLWSTGSNSYGRLGRPITSSEAQPVEFVIGLASVEALTIPPVANLGGTAQLTVQATGARELTYQWRKDGVAITGATAAGYFIGATTAADGGVYDVVITSARGSVTSESGQLTILNAPPVITSPLLTTARGGEPFEYRITANNDAETFGAAGLPAGLAIDQSTGLISGTLPSIDAPIEVTISAGNGAGTAQATLRIEPAQSPAFTSQPVARSISTGGTAVFAVTVAGNPSPELQWQVSTDGGASWSALSDDGTYSGVHGATLTISNANSTMCGWLYRCVATNTHASIPSDPVALLVDPIAPAVVDQPQPVLAQLGASAAFSASFSGFPTPTLQWQLSTDGGSSWTAVPTGGTYTGASTGTLALSMITTGMATTRYRCVATSAAGTAVTDTVGIEIVTAGVSPSFLLQPGAVNVNVGVPARFVVRVRGTSPLVYSWEARRSGEAGWSALSDTGPYRGTRSAALTISAAMAAVHGTQYRCVVTNAAGAATSAAATLTVLRGPGTGVDLDGDGRMEMVWRHTGTQELGSWTAAGAYVPVGQEGAGYEVIGYGDFDGDGRTEAVWRHIGTRALVTWPSGGGYLPLGTESGAWQVLGLGDFDGDGKSEFLWRHAVTGEIAAWTMAGAYLHLGDERTGWQVIGVGDFDGDGKTEPLWRQNSTAEIGTWTMAGAYVHLGDESTNWDVLGLGDFDGDGKTEPLWRHRSTGEVGAWTRAGAYLRLGNDSTGWTVIGTGDYDGDGKTEPLWRQASTQEVGTWTRAGAYLRLGTESNGWQLVPQAPTIATEPTASQWLRSGGATTLTVGVNSNPTAILQWQVSTDGSTWVDVVDGAEYSGSGTTSLTITNALRAMNGNRYRCTVRNGSGRATSATATLNVSARACVANDLDGDGKTDILWRYTPLQELGIWNSTGFVHLGTEGTGWVVIGVGDFDADGKMELVWRHTGSGQVATWPSGGGYVPLGTESAWQVIRIGDFDGDGRSELLWRHSGTGQVVTWTQAGAYLELGAETDGWRVIGIADFDGDGRQEPAWRNTSTLEIRTTTIAGTTISLGTEGGGWTVVAFGDVDGDGQAEPFWRHATTLENVTWTRAGGFVRLGTESSGGWHVIAVGDYDGDGKSEPLWQHETTRELATWPSGGGYLPLGTESGNWVLPPR
jgi:alpha-tubulin suppressor-like RCC1 family protein